MAPHSPQSIASRRKVVARTMPTDEMLREIAVPVRWIEEPEVRETIKKAGLIWGCDTASDCVTLLYGREMLEDIAKGRHSEFDPQGHIAFELDFRTDELEALCVAIQTLRGSHCYRSEDD